MINEKYRLSFYNKHEFSFNPLIAVIVGVVITFLCYIFMIYLAEFSYGISSVNLYGTLLLFGVISLIVGSFASTFVAKDKKIQYGIYSGLIFIIYKLLADVTHINVVQRNYYIIIINIVGYVFLAIIGSYLATYRKIKSEN